MAPSGGAGGGYSASNSQQVQSDFGAISVSGPKITFGNAVTPTSGSTAVGLAGMIPKAAWWGLGIGLGLLGLGVAVRSARRA